MTGEHTPAGPDFANDVLAALGLSDVKGVVDFSIRWNGVHGELTVTRLITRQQGAAMAAVLKRARYLVSDPADLGQAMATTPDAKPDADFRLIPTFRRPSE